ncbi:MAG: hypothetical protein C4542_08390 [Dehalococcoidia bacterium]|nr:MAG: hypothetical protein C4542_08390 [Dehalococcoidia bacterium]
MPNDSYRALLYRAITVLGVVLAFFLTLVIPQHMRESVDWSFQYATQNFSQGRFTVDGSTIGLEAAEAYKYGGRLSQYALAGDDRYALTEAPGYIFYLLPFYYIHAPELGNLVLAAGMTFVAYLLFKRLRDEKTACLGSLLLLFSPVALAMMQREYADSFAAAAFLSMGGGLYIYYCLSQHELTSRSGGIFLFLAGLGLGLSVAANYYNALTVLVFMLHFIFTSVRSWLAGRRGEVVLASVWMGLGLAIPLAGLFVYQNAVFGSPLRFGFQYSRLPVSFSLDFLRPNIKYVTVALLVGFPLLLPGIASLCMAFYNKIRSLRPQHKPEEVKDTWTELRWGILLLLAGWIAAVYGLYLNYEWTANTQVVGMPFIVMARYYLPAVLPLTIMAVLLLKRVPRKLSLALTILAAVWGVLFFAQSALSYPVVPPHSPYNPLAGYLPQNANGELDGQNIEHQNPAIETFL